MRMCCFIKQAQTVCSQLARLSRQLRRENARDGDAASARGLRPELVVSQSLDGSGDNKDTLLLYDRLDNDCTLEEGTMAQRFLLTRAKEAISASSKCSLLYNS